MASRDEIAKLRQQLEEERRRREEVERRCDEEQRCREEEQQRREDEQQRREEAENRTCKTTVPELLDACHTHLFLGLTIQENTTMSTQGDPANAVNKVRPDKIRFWQDFPIQQEAIWNDLMDSDFILERHFTSIHTLEETRNTVRQRLLGSELNLHHFLRSTIEDHISAIVQQLYLSPLLREKFNLKGSVRFENHANTLSPERQLEGDMQNMSISNPPRRRSPRLLANAQKSSQEESNEKGKSLAEARSARPRADQFCVYNMPGATTETEYRVAALIGENKSPAKLPLNFIYEGLQDMDLEDVVKCREEESSRARFRRLVAAVITQAFSYMIRAGLEYGYVCTGEAFIFLRVPDDPTIVYYFLSVPKGDVGETTGWIPDSDHPNRLHLTAVGQVLAFTLRALRTQPRGQSWRRRAEEQLETWQVVYEDILHTIPEDDAPSSEYRPPHGGNDFLRMSPVRLRSSRVLNTLASCQPPDGPTQDDGDDEFDPNTPSRKQRPSILPSQRTSQTTSASTKQSWHETGQNGNKRRYCTQRCLLGLVRGGLLDEDCPNVRDHGTQSHRISQPTFLKLMRRQLFADLDTDCDPVGVHGARGALLKVTLTSHGYTVAAKCTVREYVKDLEHEARIYKHLQPIQGIHVPVYLGSLNLKDSYDYEGVAKLVRMTFIGFGGWPIRRVMNSDNRASLIEQAKCAIQAVHQLGVWHRDAMPRNMLSNAESGQVMVIDFERSQFIKPRVVLGAVSPNRKRKRKSRGILHKSPEYNGDVFQQELQRAVIELRGLI